MNIEKPESIGPHQSEKTKTPENIAFSDTIIDKVFDKVGKAPHEGYFRDPERLLHRFDHALEKSPREIIKNFNQQLISSDFFYRNQNTSQTKHFFRDLEQNISQLAKNNLVGDDTIKLFLNPKILNSRNYTYDISQYENIQKDESRQTTPSSELWYNDALLNIRYSHRTKELADGYANRNGDVSYQSFPFIYDPNQPISHDYIHINSRRPHNNQRALRCYISPDMTKDPSSVVYSWGKSVNNSPLQDSLYYKFISKLNSGKIQRTDSIVIYKTEDIDNEQFKELLQSFQTQCDEISPELLPADDYKMPATTLKIANGLSVSAEPTYINKLMRYTGHENGRHSWNTFVDKMISLSLTLASRRLKFTPESFQSLELETETKKVFREFMLLSKIDPDTMLPADFHKAYPSWLDLDD